MQADLPTSPETVTEFLDNALEPWDGIPMSSTQATQSIHGFAARFGPNALLLAVHLAPVEQFEAELVALIRINFLPAPHKLDPSLDANLIFGPLAHDHGNGIHSMDKSVRWHLMTALNQWRIRNCPYESQSRVKQVSHFVRHYIRWKKKFATANEIDQDYLNRIHWVALAYDDPPLAAESLAAHMMTAANAISAKEDGKTNALGFTRLRPLLALPLSAFTKVLDTSHLIESLVLKDFAKANSYASNLPEQAMTQGAVTLPAPRTLLKEYQFAHHFQSAATAAGSSKQSLLPSLPDGNDIVDLDVELDVELDENRCMSESEFQAHASEMEIEHLVFDTQAADLIDPEINLQWFAAVTSLDMRQLSNLLQVHPKLLNLADERGYTALHQAAATNSIELNHWLLQEKGIWVGLREKENNTPLMLAARYGHLDIVKQLLDFQLFNSQLPNKHKDFPDTDPFREYNTEGHNCFQIAVTHGHLQLVHYLLSLGIHADEPTPKGETALALAVKAGRLAMVELLLHQGCKINYTSSQGTGLLAIAALGGNPKIINLLLELGLSPNAKNFEGFTPLMYAAYYGHLPALRFLLNRGALYHTRAIEGGAAMLFAVESGQLPLVKQLIECYPTPAEALKEKMTGDWNGLRLAALRGYPDILQYLVSLGEDIQSTSSLGWSLLHLCCQGITRDDNQHHSKHRACINYLLNKNLDINNTNSYDESPLHIAAKNNQPTIIARLTQQAELDYNAVNKAGYSPFLLAIKLKQVEAFTTLGAEPKVDVNITDKAGHQALWVAVDTRCESTVRAVLNIPRVERETKNTKNLDSALWHAANLELTTIFEQLCADRFVSLTEKDSKENQLIHILAAKGKVKLMEILLNQKINTNCVNDQAETPLITAIQCGHYAVATQLLEAGAYAVPYPETAISPLAQALITEKALEEKRDTLEQLLKKGADYLSEDSQGRTLLHIVSEHGQADSVQHLIQRGLPVTKKDHQGYTALHVAINRSTQKNDNHIAVIQYLLDAGIDINTQDDEGLTPLHHALRQGLDQTSLHLIEIGSDLRLTSNAGWCALHFAAMTNQLDVADRILALAPELIDQTSKVETITPLAVCSEYGALDVCRWLIALEADLNLSPPNSYPPAFIAARNGFDEISQLLVEAGAARIIDYQGKRLTLAEVKKQRQKLESQLLHTPARPKPKAPETETEKRETTEKSKNKGFSIHSKGSGLTQTIETGTKNTAKPVENIQPITTNLAKEAAFSLVHSLYMHTHFKTPEAPVTQPWEQVSKNNRENLITQLNPIDSRYRLHIKTTQILIRPLSFYQNIQLIRVKDKNWINPRLCIYYLIDPESQRLSRLNGTSSSIHAINNQAPIQLNENTLFDYLRFFTFFVRGDEGPFYILETTSDPNLKTPVPELRLKAISAAAHPISYKGKNDQGHYLAECTIAYANNLFSSDFIIHATGVVEMVNDQPIATDISAIWDLPIA